MYVIPKEGQAVPDPERVDTLPADGRDVPETQYWLRRLADGDVQRGQPPKPKGAKQ